MKNLDWIPSMLVCLPVATLLGCGAPPATAPTAFQSYTSKDYTFQCDYPEGWEASGGGGKRSPVWATFKSGSAEIRIRGDVSGSLLADAAGGRHADAAAEVPELAPVHQIHDGLGKETAMQDYSGYSEVAGPDEIDVRLGPARRSEFTATTTFGSGLHGYRVTALGHDKRVVVYCVCAESDWTTLKPAFDQVISSLKRG